MEHKPQPVGVDKFEHLVMRKCLRISKESNVPADTRTSEKRCERFSQASLERDVLFTGLNNLEVISILGWNYDEYFGFTEEEVLQLCTDYGLEQKYSLLREWYNGYLFGNTSVYNPWSVIRYVKALAVHEDEFSPFVLGKHVFQYCCAQADRYGR